MNDFDFLMGSWHVVNRRRRGDGWDEFPGYATCRPALDGLGNVDEIEFPTLKSRGLTLRLFDVESRQWSIYWASGTTGRLYPPVHGTFRDGRGDFYGDDTHEGRPIRVHFIWSGTTSSSPRWEQKFSYDGGRTWETDWVMELTRDTTQDYAGAAAKTLGRA
ncbi:hypothetical protein Ade02nite_79140 [Paractinoplanes deccanensis]|uniref:DUF1579 domain-containing protein n=1 Tax=Paractinoplanes deccanensis TaxID=113561 RepID=A0ABQ3YH07_9ACTN|nr:hypothetical protein [Actinoplanes deccanensis]GID79273.1 hypothetical protein Ade02nite_79140 [Actinoplanes deccanensis]